MEKLELEDKDTVKKFMQDPLFLAQKSTDATEADQQVIAKLCSNDRKSSLLLFLFSGIRGHRMEITTEFGGINDWNGDIITENKENSGYNKATKKKKRGIVKCQQLILMQIIFRTK